MAVQVRSLSRRLGGLLISRRQLLTAWFALRDRDAPWSVRLVAVAVIAYVLDPIDLIPDVIPLLGWLDDLGVLRLGLFLILHFGPAPVLERAQARAQEAELRSRRWMFWLLMALGLWLLTLTLLFAWLLWSLMHG